MVCAPYKFCIDPPLGGVLYERGYYSEGGYYMLVYTVVRVRSLLAASTISTNNTTNYRLLFDSLKIPFIHFHLLIFNTLLVFNTNSRTRKPGNHLTTWILTLNTWLGNDRCLSSID